MHSDGLSTYTYAVVLVKNSRVLAGCRNQVVGRVPSQREYWQYMYHVTDLSYTHAHVTIIRDYSENSIVYVIVVVLC